MGMFDIVLVKCDCGADVEFQSKADKCELNVYSVNTVPIKIAIDLNGSSEICRDCGKLIVLRYYSNPTVQMVRS
jgi:hypothetical protein